MQRCLELAALGGIHVAPNPLVGAVIVYRDQIIGEGYHQKYGEAHAEVNAVNSVSDKTLLAESTIYVSLEPCAHTGKTPPCAELLVASQFKRVVIGCRDSYDKVNGKGIDLLLAHGIEVSVGVLEKECLWINKRFFTFHRKQRPYVTLKWAETKDGFIDKHRKDDTPRINWISQKETKSWVHHLRKQEVAILVGKNTILNDNPSLTVREVAGQNPIRVILDSKMEVTSDYAVFDDAAPTIVFNLKEDFKKQNIQGVKIPDRSINTVLSYLYKMGIHSVFVEGGYRVLESFIHENLWDEAYQIIGENEFIEGVAAPKIVLAPATEFRFTKDHIKHYINY